MRIAYGPYEPDKPPFMHKGLVLAQNVYPSAVGYRPVGQFQTLLTGLPAKPIGAGSFVGPSGAAVILAGTTGSLFHYTPSAWVNIATDYSLDPANRWRFVQFGALAIATNGSNDMVKVDLTTLATGVLGGSPPVTKMLAVVKDFVVAGVINGVVNMVQWSGINNAEHWTVGTEQCDYQIIPPGGEVTGILGGEFGVILQRTRVSRMTYVGDNLVFQFDEISNNIGCVSTHSVAQAGALGFWLSDSGFMMWDGATIRPIGQERIDRTFAASYSNADWIEMSTAVDVKNNVVAWSMGDRIFIYNWVLDRWSTIDKATTVIFSGYSSSSDPLFYAFDSAFDLGTLSGSPMEATWGLGDLEFATGREARIASVRPLSDAVDGMSLSFMCRQRQGDAVDENIYDAMEDNGEMPVRECGRYIRLTHTIEAGTDWSYCEGLDVTVANGARR